MDLQPAEEEAEVRRLFHAFAERELRPAAAGLDEDPRFPRELFTRVGELGFFAMRYPEPEGGGAGFAAYLAAVEELAWGDLAVAACSAMQSLMGTHFLHLHASGELRRRLLGPALAGERVGTICMTEPGAGSDLGSMTTRAEEAGGVWRLTGRKTWITSAPAADFYTVFARTGEDELSVFLVERGAEGLEVGRSIEKAGVRASLTSEVGFEATPATCMLGAPGGGMDALREVLVPIRLMTAALALGVGRAAFEAASTYARERVQFGRPIAAFQAVQAHLAEMATDMEAARQLTRWAAARAEWGEVGLGEASLQEASMAKLFASEAAWRTCERAARVLASYGYAREYPVERYLRDVRFTLIGGGTSEVLRSTIARGLAR